MHSRLGGNMKDCLDYFVKIKKEEVVHWAPFFDAFQGMLSLRTPEPPKDGIATMHFIVSPDFKDDFEELLKKNKLKYD